MERPNIELIIENIPKLADRIVALHLENNPELLQRYGEAVKVRWHEEAVYHINFLVEAMNFNLTDMYTNYILWAASMLNSRDIPEAEIHDNLKFAQQAIHDIMGSEFSEATLSYVRAAKEKLKESNTEVLSYITEENPLKNEVENYLDFLLSGQRNEATDLILDLIRKGVSIKEIYEFIFQVSQYEIGRLWQCDKITVAHEHYCTAATQQIMSGIYEYIFSTNQKEKTLVACSISGELHEIGIRMVTDFFEMDGWDTYYLGANISEPQLLQALSEYKADILAISVTLPTHVSKAASLIKIIKNREDLNGLKIMVGGYPFLTNPDLWQRVSADAFAENANQAVSRANELIKF